MCLFPILLNTVKTITNIYKSFVLNELLLKFGSIYGHSL